MRGTNNIEINLATLAEALQEYFDKRLVEKPVVVEIWVPGLGKLMPSNSIKVVLQENGDFLNGKK